MASVRTSVAGGGTSSTGNRTVTITPAVGDLIVVFVSLSANTNASPTMTDNNGSGTYTRILQGLWSVSVNNMACFVRDALMVNTTSTVITCNSGSNTAGELVAVALSGMTRVGSNAVRSSGKQENQLVSTTPAPVLSQTSLSGNVVLAAVASGDTTTSPPGSGGFGELQDASQSTPTTALEVCSSTTFAGTTITFGATQGTVYGSMAVEMDGSVFISGGIASAAATALTADVQPGAVSVAGGLASATSSALAGDAQPGAVTIAGGVASATAESLTADASTTANGAQVDGGLASIDATALPADALPGGVTVQGDVAASGASALSADVIPGAVMLVGGLSTLDAAALAASVQPGAVNVDGAIAEISTSSLGAAIVVLVDGALAAASLEALTADVQPGAATVVGGLASVAAQALGAGVIGDTLYVDGGLASVALTALYARTWLDGLASAVATDEALYNTRITVMGSYLINNTVRVSVTIRDAGGELVDPGTIKFTCCYPDRSHHVQVYGDNVLKRLSVGVYYVDLLPAATGIYRYRFDSTGPSSSSEGRLVIRQSGV